jgi:adenylosuccinate lyase
MQTIWSERRKFESWRRFWAALAQAQHEAGLPVSAAQVSALRAHATLTEDDFRAAQAHERRLRHDVMAHVHALGDAAPEARGIIHLGATSQDVNCTCEAMQLIEALDLVCLKTARLIDAWAHVAGKWKDLPCLGFTHYQVAQPTTMGKRAAVWGTDLLLCLSRLEHTRDSFPLRGLKGATGTQASFLGLLGGDAAKVATLEARVLDLLGLSGRRVLECTGQTYPRVLDTFVVGDLASLASVLHKIAGDIRLLANHKEVDEPFEDSQIGSSAMPYKRNPMRCERATGLARFVMTLVGATLDTAATQWLERTLDDSATRRLVLPEAFLALDGVLDLLHDVASGLVVHEGAVRRNLEVEMPFLVTESLMLKVASELGRDRQEVHEAIRRHAQLAARAVKQEGKPNDLLERLSAEPLLQGVELKGLLDPALYTGLAAQQAQRFIDRHPEWRTPRAVAAWAALGSSAPRV